MSNPTEIVSRWIDAQPEGTLIRPRDLEHLVNRAAGSLGKARAVDACGVRRLRCGEGQPLRPGSAADRQDGPISREHHWARHRPSLRGSGQCPGLTKQVPVRQIYLTDGRSRTLTLGKQIIEIRHVPKWMLVLGDSLVGDVVRALEWLGPDLAEQAVGKLAGRIGQEDWRVVLGIRHSLPAWMAAAIQKALPTSVPVSFSR
ncbi:MAG TPA: DUF6088 family protein [Candidatus Kapabacteria bacterium]|nr:DUF6088 family protein [Candidatus Kapabacteria bacterium]